MRQHRAGRRALTTRLVVLAVAALALAVTADAQAAGPAAGTFAFDGVVTAIVHAPDGSTYVGGQFAQELPIAGGAPLAAIAGLARIAPDGSLDTGWDAHLTSACTDENSQPLPGFIRALALNASTLYAAGCFASIGGQTRQGVGAVSTATAAATAWDPSSDTTNARIFTLATQGSTVYAGGGFSMIGGQIRDGLAGLDPTTGAATAWDPNASGGVYALALSGSTLYVGGYFATMAGQPRSNLAAFDTNGTLTAWNPGAGGGVDTIAVSDATLYAAGVFATIGGQPRVGGMGAVDRTSGSPTAWQPGDASTYGAIRTMVLSGQTVYVGGDFASIAGQPRTGLAAIDAATGAPNSWTPNPDGAVLALAVFGQTVYVGGDFDSICGTTTGPYAQILNTCTATHPPPAQQQQQQQQQQRGPLVASAAPGVLSLARVGSTLRVSRSGTLVLPLSCSGQNTCRGAALILAAGGKTRAAAARKPLTIAKAHYVIPSGYRLRVTLKLTIKGRALLKRAHGRLKATLTITPAGAAAPSARKTVTLKAPKPKR
jgi:hypothetical protein